jgi:hypothetical protein
MDAISRMERILRLEGEPDRVGTFLQSPMPVFYRNYVKRYEDEIEEADVIVRPQDVTLIKHMGFDSSWLWQPDARVTTGPEMLVLQACVPRLSAREHVDPLGGIYTSSTLNGLLYSWWTAGIYDRFHEALAHPERVLDVQRDPAQAGEMRRTWEDVLENFDDFMHGWIRAIKIEPVDQGTIARLDADLKYAYDHDFVPVPTAHGVFEHSHMLLGDLGMGRMLHSKKLQPVLGEVLDCHMVRNREKMRGIKAAKARVACLADDCAYKGRPMLAPADYERWVVPRLKQILGPINGGAASSTSCAVFFHSDGYTEPYFPVLAKLVNGIESLEPKAGMDLKGLKDRWGDKVALLGNLDVGLLEFGTPGDVSLATAQCLKDAMRGGGYVFCPCTDIGNTATIENVQAMMQTVKALGRYNK